ncbi:unnamed protein product, partial [Polarella glacialis]
DMPAWHRVVLVFAGAQLFESGHGLFFELQVNPGHGHVLIGSFEADGASEGMTVTVKDPSEKQLWRSVEPSAKFSVDVMQEGSHQLCFESSVSSSQMVSFNFHVSEHSDAADPHDKSHQ